MCATVSAGITGGTVMPLYELSPEQEKIVSAAASAFASQIDLGIVSPNGKGASVGFPLIKTGVRMGDGGKAHLSVSLGYSDASIVIETEFDSLDDLLSSVGKALMKTAKLVPYSYRRFKGEDLDFTDYFDVYEDQRAFTIKVGGEVILESSDLELREFVYDGPPITDFLDGYPDSLNQLPWDDDGKEDCRDGYVDDGFSSAPGTGTGTNPGTDPGTDPTPDPDPGTDPGTDPEPTVDPAFEWGSGEMNGYAISALSIQLPSARVHTSFFPQDSPYDLTMVSDGEEYSGGNVATIDLVDYDGTESTLTRTLFFDEDVVVLDVRSEEYDYVKWGVWQDGNVDLLLNHPIHSVHSTNRISNPTFISGRLTPVESIPQLGTATYLGGMWGEVLADETYSIEGDVTLVADFAQDSIGGSFSNVTSNGAPVPGWNLDLSVDRNTGVISGAMTGGSYGIGGEVNAAFAGPNAEEILGNWNFNNDTDTVVGSGVFAGKQ